MDRSGGTGAFGFPGAWEMTSVTPLSPEEQLLLARLTGSLASRSPEALMCALPDLERWMVTEGYGKVLGRPGLTLADREVAVVALLAVHDAPVQLRSHLRGALQVGVSPSQVEAVLQSVAPYQDEGVRKRSGEVWQLVHPRRAT